jgi:hypothetical protein
MILEIGVESEALAATVFFSRFGKSIKPAWKMPRVAMTKQQ